MPRRSSPSRLRTLTSKPGVPLFASGVAAAALAISASTAGCGARSDVDHGGIDGAVSPMPPLEDAGARTDDGGRTLDTLPTDAARMDAAGLPPMPPPIDAAIERDVRFPDPPPMPIYFDTEVEPDADLVAPMPRPTQARP